MITPSDRLTLREVARELDRSLEQVRRYVREGKLPAEKIGMQWFVERSSLKAFRGGSDNSPSVDVLAKARKLREEIKNNVGFVNVIELLDQSRESHP